MTTVNRMATLRQNRGYATEQGKVWEHVANMSP